MRRKLGMKKLIVLLVAVLLLTISSFAAVTIQDQPVTIKLLGGELSISTDENFFFTDVNLSTIVWADQATQTPTAKPGYQVLDKRGSGLGWNVTMVCEKLVRTTGSPKTQMLEFQIAAGLVGLTKVNGMELDATNGPKAIVKTFGAALTAEKILTSAEDYGMGTYDYDFPALTDFRIVLNPANAYAGLYTSTFTATVIGIP